MNSIIPKPIIILALTAALFSLLIACTPETSNTEISLIETDTSIPVITQSPNTPSTDTSEQSVHPSITPSPTEILLPSLTPTSQTIRFAVIGDYGEGNQGEEDVANLVKSWSPDFIITTGDNNYPSGSVETIDHRIGQYYHQFIYPYHGDYGSGAERLRFFPSLGNHDWDTAGAQAYFDYFELPGNERYYDFVWEQVHFFCVDSDSREPDGVSMNSIQAQWLQDKLAESEAAWKLVFMHHPPYSSGERGPVDWMVWPFKEWGASVILTGHDHFYERLIVDGFPYIINGLGGGPIYAFGATAAGSQVRYNADYGAMLVTVDRQQIVLEFITRGGEVIDNYQIVR